MKETYIYVKQQTVHKVPKQILFITAKKTRFLRGVGGLGGFKYLSYP